MKGTIQVKVGKAKLDKKSGTAQAAVKATVVPIGGKKVSLKASKNGKADIAAEDMTAVELIGGGAEACTVVLGEKELVGTYGSYAIKGARNFFTSKDKTAQADANVVLDKWQGSVNAVWSGGTIRVTIAKKGKVKAAVIASDGNKASVSGILLVGDEWCGVPIIVSKKVSLAVILWLQRGGDDVIVTGLDGAIVGKPGNLAVDAKFYVDRDGALWSQISGKVLTDYLPDQVPVGQNGNKLVVAGGAKAGKLTMKNGIFDDSKAGENPSGLKLTYKAKDGSFNGSFKVYAELGGKLKSTTVNVTGVMVNGKGYGTATIKKVGSVDIMIE